MPKITIDGVEIEVKEGEYILQAARANDIFIPAICYLSNCSPTLACKMCMCEVDGKRVYSCNTKIKEGMNVTTRSAAIDEERHAIMQSYVVNHPLECGVCDQSGECELQDYTLMVGMKQQDYAVRDHARRIEHWGQIKYDPSLCIMCERCVTTCKDNIGDASLSAVKSKNATPIDANLWKDKMPKDAYSVWIRKQRNEIGHAGTDYCDDCGECAAVCPVGALGVASFQYTSNAWELNKIDSSCNLCPNGCKIVYEVKEDMFGINKIYRITNDWNFNPICGAGRFAYDIYPAKNKANIKEVADAFSKAKGIKIGGNITNNEAILLGRISSELGIPCTSNLLLPYFKFLDTYLSFGGRLDTNDSIHQCECIITLGSDIKYDAPGIRFKVNNALKMNKGLNLIYCHPIKDALMEKLARPSNFLHLDYLAGFEEIVVSALSLTLKPELINESTFKHIKDGATKVGVKKIVERTKKVIEKQIDKETNEEKEVEKEIKEKVEEIEEKDYFNSFLESNISYETFEKFQKLIGVKPLVIVGNDFFECKEAVNIAKLLALLEGWELIQVLFIPSFSNANGIYEHLRIQEEVEGYNVGYRAKANFTLDINEANYFIPAFSQMTDYMTNTDFRVLPLNAALNFKDETLQDIVKFMGLEYRLEMPRYNNFYNNDGSNVRGKLVGAKARGFYLNKHDAEGAVNYIDMGGILNFIDPVSPPLKINFNAHLRDASAHFYPYTKFSNNLLAKVGIYVSSEKLKELGIEEGSSISLLGGNIEIRGRVYIDPDLSGDIYSISPQLDNALSLFPNFRYAMVAPKLDLSNSLGSEIGRLSLESELELVEEGRG